MTKDYTKFKKYWGEKLQCLPKDYIDHFGLTSDTINFFTTVGLPSDLSVLEQAVEINFYFDKEKILKKDFKGISYIIIGDDLGTNFGISLKDNSLYAVDFSPSSRIDPVCFINTGIDKFVESIQCFVEFKEKSNSSNLTESQLMESMKARITTIDEKALMNERTWWGQLIDDPIKD